MIPDALDRAIIDRLQHGLPLVERPFAVVAAEIGTDEDTLIARLRRLRESEVLTRFGPMFNVERMGGVFVLAAVAAPPERLEAVVAAINAHLEVAHNYQREHRWNVWFVVAAETAERAQAVIDEISAETGLDVLVLPKEREYHVEFKLPSQ
jgi:DNA-binding Lrp family transcriptional regulator